MSGHHDCNRLFLKLLTIFAMQSEGIVLCQIERPEATQVKSSMQMEESSSEGKGQSNVKDGDASTANSAMAKDLVETKQYCLFAYSFPAISARFVPSVVQFCHTSLGLSVS